MDTLSSTSYCLADPGNEYLIYQPLADSTFRVNMINGNYSFEWFNPASGLSENTGEVKITEKSMTFKAPFSGDAVLYLKAMH